MLGSKKKGIKAKSSYSFRRGAISSWKQRLQFASVEMLETGRPLILAARGVLDVQLQVLQAGFDPRPELNAQQYSSKNLSHSLCRPLLLPAECSARLGCSSTTVCFRLQWVSFSRNSFRKQGEKNSLIISFVFVAQEQH